MADPVFDLAIIDRVTGDLDFGIDDESFREELSRRNSEINDFLITFAKTNPFDKPLIIIPNTHGNDLEYSSLAHQMRRDYIAQGIPAFSSLKSGARALSRYIAYHEFQARIEQKGISKR